MIISLVMMINFTSSPDSIEVTELEFWCEHFCSCIIIIFFQPQRRPLNSIQTIQVLSVARVVCDHRGSVSI